MKWATIWVFSKDLFQMQLSSTCIIFLSKTGYRIAQNKQTNDQMELCYL